MSLKLTNNATILFQGDSITDCGRNRLNPEDLGNGYVNLVNYYIQQHLEDLEITCLNRGISGNRISHLKRRWTRSTLNLEIDILSLYIGVNDTWRRYDHNIITPPEKFKETYEYLLDSAKEKNPDLQLVLMSPFVLPTEPSQLEWNEDLEPKIEIVEQLAKDYEAIYIPLQTMFNGLVTVEQPNCFWASDGVHPTAQGHIAIAKEWIKLALQS
ncbi:MAG: hypothetical protein ATN36_02580 [Epulopiscium sp. Nele67-Bin005]|nr:MAG: hypothetical protein ATN36_02580 [Epulopiscium sp. Nele67-Bin005]